MEKKFQAPDSKLQKSSKFQLPSSKIIGIWNLRFGISLEFGTCDLELTLIFETI
jgi:hypothetical protein